MSLPSHGVVRYIGEVLSAPAEFRSVRTFGSLRMDAGEQSCGFALEHDGDILAMDVSQLGEDVRLKNGSMYMVIGEIIALPDGPCLQARVARNIDGMDLELFGQTLKLYRRFVENKN